MRPASPERAPSPTDVARSGITLAARTESFLLGHPLLASLGAEAVREASRRAHRRTARRGERIWCAGEAATHFQVLVSGFVKLVDPGVCLRPAIVDVFGPSEALGYWAALDGSPYIGDAIPVTDRVETLLIPGAVLRGAVERDHAASLAMTRATLKYARVLRAKIGVMCAGSVHQRLGTLLLDLCRRFGTLSPPGGVSVAVPLTRLDLAMCVGATIETVIRVMSRWHKEGLVESLQGGFRVRCPQALSDVVHGCNEARDAGELVAEVT